MKKVLIAAALILSIVTGFAKGNDNEAKTNDTETKGATMMLTGSIADQSSGESLVGVEVKLEGTDLKTYTDFDGNFSFENVKPGEYKLLTNYISYQKKIETLKVPTPQNKLEIKLQTSK